MQGLKLFNILTISTICLSANVNANTTTYPIVDTNQNQCFGLTSESEICPRQGMDTFGQDAQYQGNQPSYTKASNGTVIDNITGLIWSQTTDINGDGKIDTSDKLTFEEAHEYVESLRLGGFDDWRLPSIKELYSLILFDGQDPSRLRNNDAEANLIPFIDNRVFSINGGDVSKGDRLIDGQIVSSTQYVSKTMIRHETVFGVNFIDGRIKGYGLVHPKKGKKAFYVLAVRGNAQYGFNQFVANGDETVTDQATGLIWQQNDSQQGKNFPDALNYCAKLSLGERTDWRLPNVKELHSIVDYSRSPATSHSPALDPIFQATPIENEAKQKDYSSYWSSTTHLNLSNAKSASYVSFGRSMGYMRERWVDVHGAGAQRSDPKVGDASRYPKGRGPQGDAIRIENMVRCVSGGGVQFVAQPQPQVEDRIAQTFLVR
ncbi:hypothetical protein VIN01S_26070 [Vibrio inusitatus NBRC 102082]|uniref:Lcl C-terminal domain-containing protein n=1 Tax=Vibrio inusitatus NBRC 102082 TaxID=1219070 RepID=A0A4Y3HX97_9VIBR|nr:DUF1566 domain-containing protein [Vibrio inusitatus]GEA51803.1 hypothetical protein VIN01S_26070 [Vibrio inusitatus NBRC 102082]